MNLMNIPQGKYSNIAIENQSGPIAYTGIYSSGYDNMGNGYSNITLKYNSSDKMLIASKGNERPVRRICIHHYIICSTQC